MKRKLYCESCDTDFTLTFTTNKPISVCPFCSEEISFIDEDEETLADVMTEFDEDSDDDEY